ncbi:MAG: cyclase family protein [Bacteroidetes bacterium]|nr:MAG: cyclase family protein [Bacteroidota bacterium]REK03460.1 MAG: cyclase family protein [Bacteroidota bacterium]REK34765.1 MAG: cyclase family protein [Bacteroidota bacterium]REK51356.1 MAG: cyclase family protein [Bacteroidota bacterium]
MIAEFHHSGHTFRADLSKPIDISMPLRAGEKNVNAFYLPSVIIEPFKSGDFVGSVEKGGPCNVNVLQMNIHGNGTHTECVGHISKEKYNIHDCLKEFFFIAELISIQPRSIFNDLIIMPEQISHALGEAKPEALIIRTRPNPEHKLEKNYSGTNPPYLHHEASKMIREKGVKHLLIDLPSVDKEEDGGKLLSHHEFWNYPLSPRLDATITELIYANDSIHDAKYLLNLQICSLINDASPSKPLLFKLI